MRSDRCECARGPSTRGCARCAITPGSDGDVVPHEPIALRAVSGARLAGRKNADGRLGAGQGRRCDRAGACRAKLQDTAQLGRIAEQFVVVGSVRVRR